VDGSTIIVVGNFKDASGNVKVDGIAAFAGGTWRNVGTNAAGTDGPVGNNSSFYAVEVVGARLYAGGIDRYIGGSALNAHGAFFRLRQPDGLIASGASGGTFAGNNVYNATGASQTKSLTVHRGNTGTFRIKVANDGLAADSFTVKGPGSGGGFTATYFDGATNVTAAVVAGTFAINNLAPGASKRSRSRSRWGPAWRWGRSDRGSSQRPRPAPGRPGTRSRQR
jgi:hypothetical protein